MTKRSSLTRNQPPKQKRTWAHGKLLLTSGMLASIILLTACASFAAPATQTHDVVDTSTNAVAPQSVLPTLEPSATLTESTDMDTEAQRLATELATEFATESIRLVNQARQEAGLQPLTENAVLGEVAMHYSQRMANEGFYGHEDPQGRQAGDRIAEAGYLAQMSAENIASGQPDAQTVVEGWLNSPGHRENIMNPELREIGAGYAYTTTPPYHHYWTHLFGTPDASVGRDREAYPELVLAQINALRAQAGTEPLTMEPVVVAIAERHLEPLVQAESYRDQVDSTLNDASGEAVQSYQQAITLSSAGTATPEEVVAQWVEGYGSSRLTDATLRAAGVAYTFVEQDEYRHYWLLILVR